MMLTARRFVNSIASIVLSFAALLGTCLTFSCDDNNTSSVDADYGTLRVRQLALSDAKGKTVVLVTAEHTSAGAPVVVLRNATGAVVQTIAIGEKK
jgi:hypothetical protein